METILRTDEEQPANIPAQPVEVLVEQFLNNLENPALFLDDAENSPQIIFHINLNGMCYTLLRRSETTTEEPPVHLSPREREIVRMIVRGLPNKYIAQLLDISPHTVATYLKRIFAKLGVNSRVEIVSKTFASNLWSDTFN